MDVIARINERQNAHAMSSHELQCALLIDIFILRVVGQWLLKEGYF
jgi:hypothetical protein